MIPIPTPTKADFTSWFTGMLALLIFGGMFSCSGEKNDKILVFLKPDNKTICSIDRNGQETEIYASKKFVQSFSVAKNEENLALILDGNDGLGNEIQIIDLSNKKVMKTFPIDRYSDENETGKLVFYNIQFSWNEKMISASVHRIPDGFTDGLDALATAGPAAVGYNMSGKIQALECTQVVNGKGPKNPLSVKWSPKSDKILLGFKDSFAITKPDCSNFQFFPSPLQNQNAGEVFPFDWLTEDQVIAGEGDLKKSVLSNIFIYDTVGLKNIPIKSDFLSKLPKIPLAGGKVEASYPFIGFETGKECYIFDVKKNTLFRQFFGTQFHFIEKNAFPEKW